MYFWSKSSIQDADQDKKITGDSHFQLIDNGEKLRINNVGYDDNGRYKCEALNIFYNLNVPGVKDSAYGSVEVVLGKYYVILTDGSHLASFTVVH